MSNGEGGERRHTPAVRAGQAVEGRSRDPLVVAMATLVLIDLVGGIVAVSTGLNTWAEAWGSKALLAAPLPMIVLQVLLTWLALRLNGRRAAIPAALLALACAVSVVSGFFDGGLSDPQLSAGTRLVQVVLLAVTGVVGVLAAAHASRSWHGRASEHQRES